MAVSTDERTFVGYVIARASDETAVENIIQDLGTQGFHRSQFSALAPHSEDRIDAIETESDRQQMRVLGTSLSASAAGLAGAGLMAAATGGLVLPAIAAGVTAAGGVAALSETIGLDHEKTHSEWMQAEAQKGGIVVQIAVQDAEQRQKALMTARHYSGDAAFSDETAL